MDINSINNENDSLYHNSKLNDLNSEHFIQYLYFITLNKLFSI